MSSQNQVTQLVLTISGEQLIDSVVQKLCHNFYTVCFKLIWKSVREKMNIQWVKRGILSFITLFFPKAILHSQEIIGDNSYCLLLNTVFLSFVGYMKSMKIIFNKDI